MTYRELAERVLFSTSLEEKLGHADELLVDEAPGAALVAPSEPGRPRDLRIAERSERAKLPKLHELEKDEERGRLLHFFANHELLATELMALALLKFPDAPKEFRRGLVKTLRDEQAHTRLYMARMAACGVKFGEFPVNGFFWRCVADMTSPLDYVSRLSLTFEQANLDYSLHFAKIFETLGDQPTAGLLHQIYKDEIAHVGYGLKWFRRWRKKEEDDWREFERILPLPLSPSRAKGHGTPFNVEGRRKAGLDDAFIAQLEMFRQSRGRTPRVYLFNPGAELCAAARDPDAWQADTTMRTLTEDLDTLSLILAKDEDVVLLRRQPSDTFLRSLIELGVPVAERVVLRGDALPESAWLRQRKLGRLRPWAWSADSHALLAPLLPNSAEEPAGAPWNDQIRQLYSKCASARLLDSIPWQEAFGGREIIGAPVESVAKAVEKMESIRHQHGTAVVKSAFSLAGRGMARFSTPPTSEKEKALLKSLVESPGGAVVEPWLSRIADFSAHYECAPDAPPRLKGFVRLYCGEAGRFSHCVAAHSFTRLLPPEVARFLNEQGRGWLRSVYAAILPDALTEWTRGTGFRGMLGIDAFFYRDAAGAVRLKPIVEINPRCTMGRVALELRERIAPSAAVIFKIHSRSAVQKAGYRDFVEFAKALRERHPSILTSGPKLIGGVLFVNDPLTARGFLGVATVNSFQQMAESKRQLHLPKSEARERDGQHTSHQSSQGTSGPLQQ